MIKVILALLLTLIATPACAQFSNPPGLLPFAVFHSAGLMTKAENSVDIGSASGSRFRHFHLAGNTTSFGTFQYTNAGPYSIGGVTSGDTQVAIRGTYTSTASGFASSLNIFPSITTLANDSASIVRVQGTLTEAGSGTHPVFSGLKVETPSIVDGVAALTAAATAYIGAAPSSATTNYALLVDTGSVRFTGGGPFAVGTTLSSTVGFRMSPSGTASGAVGAGTEIAGTVTAAADYDHITALSLGFVLSNVTAAKGAFQHLDYAQVNIAGNGVTATGAGTIDNASALKISSTPTTGTNNYSIWSAAGVVRIDGTGIFLGSGSGLAVTTGASISSSGTTLQFTGGSSSTVWNNNTNGTELMRISNAGMFLIGDNANANMTVGVTINQGANDDDIVNLKSSDVAHGATAINETDTFYYIRKVSDTAGGVALRGIMETSGTNPVTSLQGYGGTEQTTAGTGSRAITEVYGVPISGTDGANASANSLIFGVESKIGGASRALFFVDAEGDLFVDGSTTITAFDHWQDVALVRTIDLELGQKDGLRRSKHDDEVRYKRQDLVDVGVLTNPSAGAGDPMINLNRMMDVMRGGIWQTHTRINDLEVRLWARILEQEKELATMRARLEQLTNPYAEAAQ